MKRRPGKAGKIIQEQRSSCNSLQASGRSGLTEKTEGTWMGVLNLEKGDPDLRSPARDRQEWGKQWEALGICRHPKPPGTCPNITEWNKKNKKCLKKSFKQWHFILSQNARR